jgi:hypothetical protein
VTHAGSVFGQSVFDTHSVHAPLLHSEAMPVPVPLAPATGQAALGEHAIPFPAGAIGGAGHAHCPHHMAAPQLTPPTDAGGTA